MLRLRFTKTGNAIWISHLDLMRLLGRAFRRAGLMLKHSQGYSPHPELSIVMPLSVGVSSVCELADFELEEGCSVPSAEIAARMNPVLPEGIRVMESYEGGQKAGKLAWLRARLTLEYQATGNRQQATDPPVGAVIGRPSFPALTGEQGSGDEERILRSAQNDRVEALRALFSRPSLVVEKHSKKGPVEVDLAPMIREITVGYDHAPLSGDDRTAPPQAETDRIVIEVLGSAQNPTLNPLLLVTAIETYLPEYRPDFVQCQRLEIYDAEMKPFR